MKTKIILDRLNLQLFAEGAAGGSEGNAGGTTGVTGAAAGSQSGVNGNSSAPATAEGSAQAAAAQGMTLALTKTDVFNVGALLGNVLPGTIVTVTVNGKGKATYVLVSSQSFFGGGRAFAN